MRTRLGIGACALFVHAATAAAAVHCVNPASKTCQPTIQAAVDAASTGDTITIAPGVYHENVVVQSSGIKISGAGPLTIVDAGPPLTSDAFQVFGDHVVLRNLAIRNGSGQGVFVRAIPGGAPPDAVTLQGLRIVGTAGGIAIGAGTGHVVTQNDIRGVAGFCIGLAPGSGAVLRSNTIAQCGAEAIVANSADVDVVSNRITLATVAVDLTGFAATVESNTIEMAGVGIAVAAAQPSVLRNRIDGASNTGVLVTCFSCTGGSVADNAISGAAQGIVAAADAAGLSLAGNRVQARDAALALSGTAVAATSNTVSGGLPGQPCVDVAASGAVIARNVVARCGGPGFRSAGSGNTFDANTSTAANAFGFEVDGQGGANAAATLGDNTAVGTNGAGFGVVNGAAGTTLTGNRGLKNRLDLCDTTGASSVSGNAFGATSTTCDVLQ